MSIIAPKFVALDSAHVARLAQDATSKDRTRQTEARSFIDTFAGRGGILVLSFHHLAEVLRHGDAAVIAERIAFLRTLPLVAWVTAMRADSGPGSIVDILAYEVESAFRQPAGSRQDDPR